MRFASYNRRCFLLLQAVWIGLLVGCGRDAVPNPYQVSGTVSFAGQPVPKGFITFSPDTSLGNSGPGGGAAIVDGKYKTEPGKGIVGGAYVVRIVGYDGVATAAEGEELQDGKPLFVPYQSTVEFPAEDVTQDFEVPQQ